MVTVSFFSFYRNALFAAGGRRREENWRIAGVDGW